MYEVYADDKLTGTPKVTSKIFASSNNFLAKVYW